MGGGELQLRDDIWAPKTMLRFIRHAPVEQLPYRTATYCCILYGAMRGIYHKEEGRQRNRERERDRASQPSESIKVQMPKNPNPNPSFFSVGQRAVSVCRVTHTPRAPRPEKTRKQHAERIFWINALNIANGAELNENVSFVAEYFVHNKELKVDEIFL